MLFYNQTPRNLRCPPSFAPNATQVFGLRLMTYRYPYYGTWFLGIIAELSPIVTHLYAEGIHKSSTALDYVSLVIRILRTCILIALPLLYFGLRNDKKIV